MNEIKKIHLGRQPFTISKEAYEVLRTYLEAIKRQAGKQTEVVKEVEARMAELLVERGLTPEKVVLLEDVEFLKQQLGEPSAFKTDGEAESSEAERGEQAGEAVHKRLYRDTENGMIAGVSAGLAAFFGIDVIIVRLIFVILTIAGASGILVYLLLWLLVPEAKTPSEKLQMRGKAVTVGSLKEVIDRADVPGAANRAGRVAQRVVGTIGKILLIILGVAMSVIGAALFLWTMIVGTYLLIHGGEVAGELVFPIGTTATVGLVIAMIGLVVLAFLILVAGLAMIRRKRVLPGWAVAACVGVFLLAGSVATAIGFDTVPAVRDKYESLRQVQVEPVPAFTKAELIGSDTEFSFVPSEQYSVEVQYFNKTPQRMDDLAVVKDGKLYVDTSKYDAFQCKGLCLVDAAYLRVIVRAPHLDSVDVHGENSFLEQVFPGPKVPQNELAE